MAVSIIMSIGRMKSNFTPLELQRVSPLYASKTSHLNGGAPD